MNKASDRARFIPERISIREWVFPIETASEIMGTALADEIFTEVTDIEVARLDPDIEEESRGRNYPEYEKKIG